MNKRKPRILWNGEFTQLATGYGNYGRELLTRLHDTGKYEIAELASYGRYNDAKSLAIPWKYYGNMPDTEDENNEYNQEIGNQWGKWRFEEVCLDFKPDVCLDVRDWWSLEFLTYSPFRNFYHLGLMPTVDSAPQVETWLATYLDADSICTYTEFGRDTLLQQTNGRINFVDVCTPCPDNCFKPVEDKEKHKMAAGFNEGVKIVGTVMRNQKRKLFPDLIQAFKLFLHNNPSLSENTYLYLHTSYPDSGWNIPLLIKESGIGHKIICTYICSSCDNVFPSFFHDARQTCPKCGAPNAQLPNADKGVSREELAAIINCFDMYVQYSITEGCGMPLLEAAACAVPIMAVNYSGMESLIKNMCGIPINVERFFREAETHAYRAYPDNLDFANKLAAFFNKNKNEQKNIGYKTYVQCKAIYDWDLMAQKWINIIDNIELKPWEETWLSPSRASELDLSIPTHIQSDTDFVRYCVQKILGQDFPMNSYVVLRMIKDLNYGESIAAHGGLYYAEDSLISNSRKYSKFERQDVINSLVNLKKKFNYWESRRVGNIIESTPAYIQRANS